MLAHGEVMLLASLVMLAAGPLILLWARLGDKLLAAVHGFVLVAVVGLVATEVLPLALGLAGWKVAIAVVIGYLAPAVFERFAGDVELDGDENGSARRKRAATIGVVATVAGLILHALTDGVALAGAHLHAHAGFTSHGHGLELAVVLHRLPVGLAVYWMLSRRGTRSALVGLGMLAAATVVGFVVGDVLAAAVAPSTFGLFEGFVAGLLLHVLRTNEPVPASCRRHEGWGGLAALGVIALTVGPDWAEFGVRREIALGFWSMLVESAPALLLAYLISGLLGSFFGQAPANWMRRGSTPVRSLKGVAFGLPLPLCSCGVVPVYQSLVRRGAPAAAGMAFLVATPELGTDAVLLSLPLLGGPMALVRVGAAFIVALFVGWLVGGWVDRTQGEPSNAPEASVAEDARGFGERVVGGLRTGFVDVVDDSVAWILVGLLIAALVGPFFDAEALTAVPAVLQVGLFALVGMPIYVCAAGATPMAAVLIAKGLSPGAALAFLLTGPATNATTFGVLRQLHGRKAAFVFMAAVVLLVVALGYGVDLFWPSLPTVEAGAAHEHGFAWWQHAMGLAVAGLFAASFVRQGPRAFAASLRKLSHVHDHDHDHDAGAGGEGDDHGCCAPTVEAPSSCCAPAPEREKPCCGD